MQDKHIQNMAHTNGRIESWGTEAETLFTRATPGTPASIYIYNTILMYSGITSGRVLDGELLNTKILGVNSIAFAHILFHRDFSPIDVPLIGEKSL